MQDEDEPFPPILKSISIALSVALILLALAIAWWWAPDSAWAKLIAFLLFTGAAPPFSFLIVLEAANHITDGELKRTGRLKP